MPLNDGHYAVRYKSGCRAIRLLTSKDATNPLFFGKRILFFNTKKGWVPFAILTDTNEIQFLKQYAFRCSEQQLNGIRAAVRSIIADPDAAIRRFQETELSRD